MANCTTRESGLHKQTIVRARAHTHTHTHTHHTKIGEEPAGNGNVTRAPPPSAKSNNKRKALRDWGDGTRGINSQGGMLRRGSVARLVPNSSWRRW
jgi:hypothetical protein